MRVVILMMVLCTTLPSFAGVMMEATHTDLATKKVQTSQTVISDGSMATRLDVDGLEMLVIYRAKDNASYIVNTREKTYMKLTPADVAGYMANLEKVQKEVLAKLKEQMASLSVSQRTHIEAMMQDSVMPEMPPAPTKFVKVEGADKVGEWPCQKYAAYAGNVKVFESCVVPSAMLGMSPAEYDVIDNMQRQFSDIAGGTDGSVNTYLLWQKKYAQEMQGVPVRTTQFADGKPVHETIITSASARTIAPASFDIPADFKMRSLTAP